MNHPFENYLVCRDNYLKDVDRVNELFNRQKFYRMSLYPGYRTDLLHNSEDSETREFAIEFMERLCVDVFPGISDYNVQMHFHYYESTEEESLNYGVVHSDGGYMAGLVYLSKDEEDFNSGTSIYLLKSNKELYESEEEKQSKIKFNSTGIADETYKKFIERNSSCFDETMKIGNKYNRLVAYDANLFHSPNCYTTKSKQIRKSLVFFIKDYNYG